MRIAWRYNNLEKIDSEQGADRQTDGKNNYYFDLSKQIAQERLDQLNVTTFTETASTIPAVGDAHPLFTNEIFASLLTSLKNKLNADEFGLDPTTSPKNLMRVSIQSLGSPLWWNKNFSADLCLFLTLLKSLVRHSLAVCCITIPTHLFKHSVSPASVVPFCSFSFHLFRNCVVAGRTIDSSCTKSGRLLD